MPLHHLNLPSVKVDEPPTDDESEVPLDRTKNGLDTAPLDKFILTQLVPGLPPAPIPVTLPGQLPEAPVTTSGPDDFTLRTAPDPSQLLHPNSTFRYLNK